MRKKKVKLVVLILPGTVEILQKDTEYNSRSNSQQQVKED